MQQNKVGQRFDFRSSLERNSETQLFTESPICVPLSNPSQMVGSGVCQPSCTPNNSQIVQWRLSNTCSQNQPWSQTCLGERPHIIFKASSTATPLVKFKTLLSAVGTRILFPLTCFIVVAQFPCFEGFPYRTGVTAGAYADNSVRGGVCTQYFCPSLSRFVVSDLSGVQSQGIIVLPSTEKWDPSSFDGWKIIKYSHCGM